MVMHPSYIFTFLLLAGLAWCQLPFVPSCSLECFLKALGSDGCSKLTDFACHCQKPALVGTMTPCVKEKCGIPDRISVSNVVVSQCSEVGHPISIPPIEGATTTTSAGTTSASASTSSPKPGSTTASVTLPTVSSTPLVPTKSSPVPSSSHRVPSSSVSQSAPSSSHASASTPTYTGAANLAERNTFGAMMVVAAAVYIM
ncbi:hypothetical protein FE257_011702 [Aspergillus nanangensis]|uniref:CFEM domain-containing protein n=1 Tax=Aspergillus nanangensis TaxID=2582783 RepID=A0AAD4CVL6_ASPNN|nr:hypothetical protein FE257_011702 [Aspergillus nanangensis]